MKKKLSLTEKISLAENNAVDFMHACVTIALHDEYEVGVQRVYAAACAEVLGFGAKRLNDLHKAVLENFRQLSAWAIEDGVDVALERFLPLRPGRLQDRRAGGGHPGRTGAASAAAPDPAGTGRAGRAGLDGGGQPQAGGLPAAGPGGSGKAHPDRAAGPGHAGELGEEAGEMTEIWAGICRLIRIQAYDVQIWLLERKKWLLDCRIGALDAQIWCCKKVIEITEAWE